MIIEPSFTRTDWDQGHRSPASSDGPHCVFGRTRFPEALTAQHLGFLELDTR